MPRKILDHKKVGKPRAVVNTVPETELEPYVDYGSISEKPTAPFRPSFGEIVTGLTLLYACSISSFNAGYFGQIRGHFVEFFTLSDLVGTNISILQYFIFLFAIYFILAIYFSFLSSILGIVFSEAIKQYAESFALKHHLSNGMFWIAYLTLVCMFYGINALYRQYGITNFSLLMIPDFIFQGVLLYFFWIGYKFELVPARSLATAALIALFITSNNAGAAWLKSEIADNSRVQAIADKDGGCFERNILRNSASGLLLYNPTMQQFEFRSKDWFKTIFEGRGCS